MRGMLRFCSHHLLVLVTLCTLAGAAAAGWWEAAAPWASSPPLLLPLFSLCALSAFLLPSRARPLTTLPFFFLVGWVHTQLALSPPSAPGHIFSEITQKTKATVVGTVVNMPEYDGRRTKFILDCQSLLQTDTAGASGFHPVHGRLQVSLQNPPPSFLRPGRTIMFIATLDRLHKFQIPGAIDFPRLMAGKNIYCTAWIQSPNAMEPVYEQKKNSLLSEPWRKTLFFPQEVRLEVANFLKQSLPAERAGLYQALLIGSLVNIPPETLEAFKAGGVFHILAISGLHFSLLALFAFGAWLFLLKRSEWLLIHTHVPTLALLMTAPFLLFYAFVAGLNVPALRALITALLVLFAVLIRRQRSLLPVIAAAALCIFALTPLAQSSPSISFHPDSLSSICPLSQGQDGPFWPIGHGKQDNQCFWSRWPPLRVPSRFCSFTSIGYRSSGR